MQLAALRRQMPPGAEAERVAQAERISGSIQQELAQILDEMRASDAALPFAERLRLRATGWSQVSGIELVADLADVDIAPPEQETILRIADEALANVLRHSGATRVHVSLRRDRETLALDIADNGRGGIADAEPGLGIANNRTRVATLPGGRGEIDSETGGGTRVRVRFATVA
jgi:signal transduction histidine kinase